MHADQHTGRRLITRTAIAIMLSCLSTTFLVGLDAHAKGQIAQAAPKKAPQRPAGALTVRDWFVQYDQIRRNAQMSPAERQRADELLSKGLSLVVPGQEKTATQALLNKMVTRYKAACDQLSKLPELQPTSNLHHTYYNYFRTAGELFGDYVRVQDSLFATDANGDPLAGGLMQRKQNLEALEQQCKTIDEQTRGQYNIPPYTY